MRLQRIYVIHDQRDGDGPAALEDFLFEEGYEVIVPVFDGDEAELRDYHEENLSICDGVLIYYGAGNELWLRRKLREIQKSAGYGRKRPDRGQWASGGAADAPDQGAAPHARGDGDRPAGRLRARAAAPVRRPAEGSPRTRGDG